MPLKKKNLAYMGCGRISGLADLKLTIHMQTDLSLSKKIADLFWVLGSDFWLKTLSVLHLYRGGFALVQKTG
jgi:hypothetical protein